MSEEKSRDEMRPLKDLLGALESGQTTMQSGGKDVTARGVLVLKREIARLEEIIVDLRLKMARNA